LYAKDPVENASITIVSTRATLCESTTAEAEAEAPSATLISTGHDHRPTTAGMYRHVVVALMQPLQRTNTLFRVCPSSLARADAESALVALLAAPPRSLVMQGSSCASKSSAPNGRSSMAAPCFAPAPHAAPEECELSAASPGICAREPHQPCHSRGRVSQLK